ncbi:MAG: hypothetical protein COA52_01135 [Hyphomicrobiales bacterium]|nr:MAG: hypothetical protein COA52_00045 [Hyphomicrobiales bacterium]PCJ96843.1 MAG: hypothetical protein COA52_01135 [Hyphomicrobiales bacterium]
MHFKYKSKIIYTEKRNSKKRANKPWIIVPVDLYLINYYRTLLENEVTNIFRSKSVIQASKWQGHVTVLDGRKDISPKKQKLWKKYNYDEVEFEYSNQIQKHWKFYSLPVKCEYFNFIRKELGLNEIETFHITIGREY